MGAGRQSGPSVLVMGGRVIELSTLQPSAYKLSE